MKKEIIQETVEWTKDLDPSDCYSKKLAGANLKSMKDACANTVEYGAEPDLKQLIKCLDKRYFCNSCCGYYIGPANEGDKIKCESRCKTILNQESNGYFVEFQLPKPISTQK